MGAELVHFEISVNDLDKVASFYRNTLGWKIEPAGPGMEEYLLISTSDREGAVMGGMMKKQVPEQTNINYYKVDSIEDFNARVKENGGQVVVEKMAVPKMGYFSVCLDPEGNPFSSWLDDENAS